MAGAVAIGVHFSPWLLVCTILLALFLALAKRRHEHVTLDDAVGHRQILAEYSPYLLDQMIAVVTASCLTAYAFYTLAGNGREVPHRAAGAHDPFVIYGIFRYLSPRPSPGAGREPGRRAAHGPPAARRGRAVGGAIVVIVRPRSRIRCRGRTERSNGFEIEAEGLDVERAAGGRAPPHRGARQSGLYTEEELRYIAEVRSSRCCRRATYSSACSTSPRARRAVELSFDPETIYRSSRGAFGGVLALSRRLLRPVQKLFWNPTPMIVGAVAPVRPQPLHGPPAATTWCSS